MIKLKKIIVFSLLLLPFLNFNILAQETIMITAATGALGTCICEQLASEGKHLIITGRNPVKLDSLVKSFKSKYPSVEIQSLIIDFSNINTIEEAVKKLEGKTFNGIVLIGPRSSLSKDSIPTPQEWTRAFLETFIAPLEVIKQFSSNLQNGASIVIISGATSKYYSPNYPNTNVIRIAWSGEVKNLAVYFGPNRIRVNCLSPGVILTEHHIKRIEGKSITNHSTFEKELAQETAAIPLKSYGKPQDVANSVSFLLSSKSAHINGTNMVLDGGESRAYN